MSRDPKNIIFDLGGVIINLNIDRTISAFNKESEFSFGKIYESPANQELFGLLEKGKISDNDFFAELRRQSRFTGSDQEMLSAWNAMLLDVPEERL